MLGLPLDRKNSRKSGKNPQYNIIMEIIKIRCKNRIPQTLPDGGFEIFDRKTRDWIPISAEDVHDLTFDRMIEWS